MTTRKVENPNKKGNTAFIWAVLAVLAIALVVIGLIVFNGRENRSAAIKEGMIDVEGINVAWNEDEDIIHLTGSNADAKTAELFEDFSCTHCADLHIASDEAMIEKLKAGEINVDLRPMTALDKGEEGHSTKALAAELALFANGDLAQAFTIRDYLFQNQQTVYNKYDNDGFADMASDYEASKEAVQDIRDGKYLETAKRMGANNMKYQEDKTGEAWTPRVLVDGKDIEDIEGKRDDWPQTLSQM
ncbi:MULTISPECIES: thioredoxin domain-containing protein [unclassified Corynebacterium]|uniref:DsbA family protein n=1 Tax=unclassified Corynebacterium TaxID=2624378 RepID=UPI001EF46636|nr:DsbA family protein [Corynebacterium sp. ACRPZ]MCG7294315.1 DsbA family protein [Corynebacterium sp. ACRPY]